MKTITIATFGLIAASAFAPSAMAEGREPGSILVFPVHRSGAGSFAILNVTNTNTQPATPWSFGGSTNVHFEYYNTVPNQDIGNPFLPAGCVVFDRVEFLTPADSLSVLTTCHNPTTLGGQEGYAVVTAQDPELFAQNWSHNYLVGSSLVINSSGTVYSMNAYPLEAHAPDGNAMPNGQGLQVLESTSYEQAPKTLMADSFVALNESQLSLISITRQDYYIRDLYLGVWNDNEQPLSATLAFSCWFDQPLSTVSPLFTDAFLKSTVNAPEELDINCDQNGELETGWIRIETRGIRLPSGAPVEERDLGMIGAITSGATTNIQGGHLLWELDEAEVAPDPE